MPTKRALTQLEKTEICTLRIQGVPNRIVAQRLGLHEVTVCRVYRNFLKESAPVSDDLKDWRSEVRGLAIRALKRGLSDGSDFQRAGTLAVAALRGLGELEPSSAINIQALIATIPEAHRDRYLSLDAADGDVIEGGDGNQTTEENDSEK